MKTLMMKLSLGYEKTDACQTDCMLCYCSDVIKSCL